MSIWSVVDRPYKATHRHRKYPQHTCMVVARGAGVVQSIDIPGVIRSWTPEKLFEQTWESLPLSGILGMFSETGETNE